MLINFLMNYYLYKNFEKNIYKNFEKNILNDSKFFVRIYISLIQE